MVMMEHDKKKMIVLKFSSEPGPQNLVLVFAGVDIQKL